MSHNMTSVRTIASVPAVRYRDAGRGNNDVDRELLIAGSLFAALVVIGTAFFFAVAPAIADFGTPSIVITPPASEKEGLLRISVTSTAAMAAVPISSVAGDGKPSIAEMTFCIRVLFRAAT